MGNQGHNSRQNRLKVKRPRVAQVHAPARTFNSYDGTGRAPHPAQQSRPQQHLQSRLPQEEVATAPGSTFSSQQPEDFAYGSQPTDGRDMQDVDDISVASPGSGDHDASLADAVSALSSNVQTSTSVLQTSNNLLKKLLDEMATNNRYTGELRAAARINTKTVQTMMDFLKLNNLPQVSPVQGYDGTGPATRRPRRVSPLRAAAVSIVLHCNRHPDEDYLPLHDRAAGPTCAAWTATHRENRSRQLVIVQELRNDRLTELRSLAAISSSHVAHLLAGLELRAHSRSAHQTTPGTASWRVSRPLWGDERGTVSVLVGHNPLAQTVKFSCVDLNSLTEHRSTPIYNSARLPCQRSVTDECARNQACGPILSDEALQPDLHCASYWWICSIKVVGAGQSKRVWAPDARWIAANNGARLAVKKFLRKSGTSTNLSHGSLSRLHEAMTVAVSFRETGESSGSVSATQQSSGDAPASGCGSQTSPFTMLFEDTSLAVGPDENTLSNL
ncbi:hypothetical protein ARSEF4850_007830 [Beauveria asiatica]